jgi:hypothetical protein
LLEGAGVLIEARAEAGSGTEEEGADGGVGFAKDGGDLRGGEIVEGGEEEDVAFESGEALPFAEDGFELLGLVKGLVGGESASDEALGEESVHLLRTDAAAAIEGEVPGDADEPDAEVADGGERFAVFEDADEGVLHDIFGFGGVAQDGVGDAEEEGGVGLDERGKVDGGARGARAGGDQTEFLGGCHAGLVREVWVGEQRQRQIPTG